MTSPKSQATATPSTAGSRMRAFPVIAAVLLAIAALLWTAWAEPAPTEAEAVRTVAESMRCPTCIGESVADSTSPIAAAMHDEIARQVADGRSPDAIRTWFAERYGAELLLDPPPQGAGWVLWAVPVVVAGGVAVVLIVRQRPGERRRAVVAGATVVGVAVVISGVAALVGAAPSAVVPDRSHAGAGGQMSSAEALSAAAQQDPGDVGLRVAAGMALAEEGQLGEAAKELAAAVRLSPQDADIAFVMADVLLKDGQTAQAATVLDETLARHPDHASSLLLRGTILWQEGDEEGRRLLERFVELEPDDPFAADVRARLVEEP